MLLSVATKAAASASEAVSPTAARPRADHLGPGRPRPLLLDAPLAEFRDRGYADAARAEAWLAMRGVEDPASPARLLAHALVGAAEAAARALLAAPERWEPETMGPVLARMIVRGERAIAHLTANEGDAA